ncbi:MAG: hypothetical protein ACO1SX_19405 [Actinomycetota bacterium]
MRWCLLVLLALCGCAGAVCAQPAEGVAPRGSLDCRDTPLRSALALLRAQSGLVIKLDESVPNVRVTLTLNDVPYEDILRVLVRQTAVSVPGLRVSRLGDAYAVHRLVAQPGEPTLILAAEPLASPTLNTGFLRKVSVGFRDEGARQALARVFDLAGAPFAIEPNVPNVPVTVNVRTGTAWEALRLILTAAQEQSPIRFSQIVVGQIGEVYVVALRSAAPGEASPAVDRITLTLDQVPLKLAAEALFRGTTYRYAFSPAPGDRTISLHLQDVPLEVALGRLEQEASRAGVRLTWARR